jgi:predicted nucleic acid-binding protein
VIVVWDTAALIKRYITEDGSERVNQAWDDAGQVAASWLAEAEMLAVFARKRREAAIDATLLDQAERNFLIDWPSFIRIEASRVSSLLQALHRSYALRGADSIHLATALLLRRLAQDDQVHFATADERLAKAATTEKLDVLP